MKTDREKQSLLGPVKIVEIETAQLKEREGQIVGEPCYGHEITFNEDGNIVEQVNRNPDGSALRTLNDYSGAGKLLASRHYDPCGNLTGEIRYVYDGDRLIAERYVTVDGKVWQ